MGGHFTAIAATTGILLTGVGCSPESPRPQVGDTPPYKVLEAAQSAEIWPDTGEYQPGPYERLKLGEKVIGICIRTPSGQSEKIFNGAIEIMRNDQLAYTFIYAGLNQDENPVYRDEETGLLKESELANMLPPCDTIDVERAKQDVINGNSGDTRV